jgi:hypothetical protein
MNRFKNHVIVAAVFSVLAIIGSIMNSHQAAAQGPPGGMSVNIVNPLPVPVTGSITSTVTGTVGLASGTTVGLASGASVRLNNTVTDPVRVRNVNDAIQPFQTGAGCSEVIGQTGCNVDVFTVPAGKRAVIEYFSGVARIDAGQVALLDVTMVTAGFPIDQFLALTTPAVIFPSPVGPSTTWGQQVRWYADPGTIVNIQANQNGPATTIFVFTFRISGYFVDVPLTP